MRKQIFAFVAVALTAAMTTVFATAATAPKQQDVTAEMSDENLPGYQQFYDMGVEALQQGEIDEAINNLNMAYCFSIDEDKAFADKALKQLTEIKKKYGDEHPVALVDLLKKFKKVEFANFDSFQVTDRNGKTGIYSLSGKEIVPPVYDDLDVIFTNNNGQCWVLIKNGKKGLVDDNGTHLLPIDYDDVMEFECLPSGAQEELSYFYVVENGKEGFVEQNSLRFFPFDGKVISLVPAASYQDPAEAVVVAVAPGAMPTTTDDDKDDVDLSQLVKYALTLDGRVIIPVSLEATEITAESGMFNLKRYQQNDMPFYAITKGDGTVMQDFSRNYPRQLHDYIPIPDYNGKWAIYDCKNWEKAAIGPFDDVRHVVAMQSHNWYFAAKQNGKYALIDPVMLTPLTPFALDVRPYDANLLKETGVMDMDPEGEEMSQEDFDSMAVNALIVIDGKNVVLGGIYDNDLLFATRDGDDNACCGIADTKGNIIIQPKYVDITPFHGGKALAKPSKEENYIVIDRRGTQIDTTNWDAAIPLDGMIIVRAEGDENRVGAIDYDLNILHPCVHTASELFQIIFSTDESDLPADQ